jgi:hypothetical protein
MLDTQYNLLMCKYDQVSRDKGKFGEAKSWSNKLVMGWVFVFGLLGLIFLPLLMFSSFMPFQIQNSVIDTEIKLSLVLGGTSFELYSNSHAKSISNITQQEYHDNFAQDPYMLSQKPYLNTIMAYKSSYSLWPITAPMLGNLQELLVEHLSNREKKALFSLEMKLHQSFQYSLVNNTTPVSGETLLNIYEMISKCTRNYIEIDNLYYMIMKLSSGKTSSLYKVAGDKYKQKIQLRVTCLEKGQAQVGSYDDRLNTTRGYQYYWSMLP